MTRSYRSSSSRAPSLSQSSPPSQKLSAKDLVQRVQAAMLARQKMSFPDDTNVIRLFHGIADGVPDLYIDRYGAYARIDMHSAAWPFHVDAIANVLLEMEPKIKAVVGLYKPSGRPSESHWFRTDGIPASVCVQEAGMQFVVRIADPASPGVGIFADHRVGREKVQQHAMGKPVLNLFAHAGAFGVAALWGGASRIDHVDMAKKCAPWSALNLAINGTDPRQHRFVVDDALKFLQRAAKKGPAYGVIACDPPAAALTQKGERFIARDAMRDLAANAIRALLPMGALVLSTNDRGCPVELIQTATSDAARLLQRKIQHIEPLTLGPDFRVNTWRSLDTASRIQIEPMRGVYCVFA